MANPILVEVSRDPEDGRFVESRHRGAIAIVDRAGDVVFSTGDSGHPMCPRSAFKAMQALPMLESGGAERFDLEAADIALSCSSHNGQSKHIERVGAWLDKIDCTISDLECGPHLPIHVASAHEMIERDETPSAIHNNCSGKHTGFLTLARLMNAPVKGYTDPDHPVQEKVKEVISGLVGLNVADHMVGRDGCHAPNYQMPLMALALGMSRLANPDKLPGHRRKAAELLIESVTEEPFYLAGDERPCTALTRDLSGPGFVKSGAEGVYTACLPTLGFGIAIKVDDGAARASAVVIANLLRRLGVFEHEEQLVDWFDVPLHNTKGQTTGFVTASQVWDTFELPKP